MENKTVKTKKTFLQQNLLTIIGVGVGAVVGFLYWNFIGCNSGTCAITSKPVNSTVYGAVMGGLIFSLFTKKTENDK